MFRTNTVEKAKKEDQNAFMQLIDQRKAHSSVLFNICSNLKLLLHN
jgi:hypothetical protein